MNFLSVVSQLCGKIICLCNNAILQVVWVYIICEQAPCKLRLGDNAPQESQSADLIHVTSMIDYQRDMVSLQRVSFFNSFFVVYRAGNVRPLRQEVQDQNLALFLQF